MASCEESESHARPTPGVWEEAHWGEELKRDLRVLARFIAIYCTYKHRAEPKLPAALKSFNVAGIAGRELRLCEDCRKLLAHAFRKRSACPMDPKPACRHCPEHCYHPTYRRQIREVMKYSGWRLLVSGRLDYLFRLLF